MEKEDGEVNPKLEEIKKELKREWSKVVKEEVEAKQSKWVELIEKNIGAMPQEEFTEEAQKTQEKEQEDFENYVNRKIKFLLFNQLYNANRKSY